jgi:hypothetical protein
MTVTFGMMLSPATKEAPAAIPVCVTGDVPPEGSTRTVDENIEVPPVRVIDPFDQPTVGFFSRFTESDPVPVG